MNHRAFIFAFINLLVVSSESKSKEKEEWNGMRAEILQL